MKQKTTKVGFAYVTKQRFDAKSPNGPEDLQEEMLEVRTFTTVPAEVQVEFGVTLNQGNFESVRITVGMRIPCYVEERDDAYAFAREWVSHRIGVEQETFKKPISVKSTKAEPPPIDFFLSKKSGGSIMTDTIPDGGSDKKSDVGPVEYNDDSPEIPF